MVKIILSYTQRIVKEKTQMQNNKKINQLVITSLFAALTCIATMVIRIPTIGTSGYVNIGDTIVLISSWILGFPYGALAAGIGSGLADLLAGYAVYVPGTTIIKFTMAAVSTLIFKKISQNDRHRFPAYIVSSIAAEIIMIVGYFLYESTLLGYGLAAASSIISNAVQGITCLVLGLALINALNGSRYLLNRYIMVK